MSDLMTYEVGLNYSHLQMRKLRCKLFGQGHRLVNVKAEMQTQARPTIVVHQQRLPSFLPKSQQAKEMSPSGWSWEEGRGAVWLSSLLHGLIWLCFASFPALNKVTVMRADGMNVSLWRDRTTSTSRCYSYYNFPAAALLSWTRLPQSLCWRVFRTDVQILTLRSLPGRSHPSAGDLVAQTMLFSCLGSAVGRLCKSKLRHLDRTGLGFVPSTLILSLP